jgi:hypothetical protein
VRRPRLLEGYQNSYRILDSTPEISKSLAPK